MLLISSSCLGRYGACCLWLGVPSKTAFFPCWAGVLRVLQKCTLPRSAAPRHLEWVPSQAKISSPCILLGGDYALEYALTLYCWGSPYSHVIQPDLCLPVDRQGTGRWEEDFWQKGTRPAAWALGSICRQQEAHLRQHWRQEGATTFGVEPEERGLGKRDVLGFVLYKHFMKCLMGICLLQEGLKYVRLF